MKKATQNRLNSIYAKASAVVLAASISVACIAQTTTGLDTTTAVAVFTDNKAEIGKMFVALVGFSGLIYVARRLLGMTGK